MPGGGYGHSGCVCVHMPSDMGTGYGSGMPPTGSGSGYPGSGSGYPGSGSGSGSGSGGTGSGSGATPLPPTNGTGGQSGCSLLTHWGDTHSLDHITGDIFAIWWENKFDHEEDART